MSRRKHTYAIIDASGRIRKRTIDIRDAKKRGRICQSGACLGQVTYSFYVFAWKRKGSMKLCEEHAQREVQVWNFMRRPYGLWRRFNV